MTAPRGFARLTPAQRAEVARKGGYAAHAARYGPTGINPHTGAKRYCYACGTKHPEGEMRILNPVAGLTVWLCRGCTP